MFPFICQYVILFVLEGCNVEDEMLTIEQVAQYLKICNKTVRRLIRNDSLTASRVSTVWRIKMSDVENYLNSHTNGQKGTKLE